MSETNNQINQETEKQLLPVDTVKITIPKGCFRLKKFRHFRLNCVGLTRTATKQEKQNGFYRPKVTIGRVTGSCIIEVSLPKLLLGNNLQELRICDFSRIVRLLRVHLWSYGIEVSKENLRNADLCRVDFGKNLNLTSICSVADVLDTLKRCIGFGRKFMYQIQYQNGGRALRLQNATTDLLLYDKLHSYELTGLSEKLSVERDHYCQKPLYELLTDSNKSILRLEQRYIKRDAVRRVFALYRIAFPTFEDICNPKIGQDVITTEWQMLVKSCILPTRNEGKNLLEQILAFLKKGNSMGLRNICTYVLMQRLLQEYSVRDLRKRFIPYVTEPTIWKLFNDVKKWAQDNVGKVDILDEVSRQIMDWQPINIDWHSPTENSYNIA